MNQFNQTKKQALDLAQQINQKIPITAQDLDNEFNQSVLLSH
jgi:hypothetical protein